MFRFAYVYAGAGALLLAGLIAPTSASAQTPSRVNARHDGHAYVINSSASPAHATPLADPYPGDAYVVHRPVFEPAAVVSRQLADQPVYPQFAELHQGGVTVFVDPTADYLGRDPGHIDEDNPIIQAQRLYRARSGRGVMIIRNPNVNREGTADRGPIQPRAIIRIRPTQPDPAAENAGPKVVRAD